MTWSACATRERAGDGDAQIPDPHSFSNLTALVSAINPTELSPDGVYRFEMPHPVPPYLVAHSYAPADEALERFLVGVGRQFFIEPLYKALAATPEGLARARRVYGTARPGYHPVVRRAIDDLLESAEE